MHAEQLVDWEYVEAELRRLPMPDAVRGLRLSWGEDATGDEAVWVWLRVEEGAAARAGTLEALKELKERIRDKLSELVPGIWPYIRLEN